MGASAYLVLVGSVRRLLGLLALQVPTMTAAPGHARFDHDDKDLALINVPRLVESLKPLGEDDWSCCFNWPTSA
ncbi:hypothetical protein FXF50_00300 [Micromonospora sp. AP08]|uniref:hypothetical protein n=1 Tax=Micromonospora sp. AP08 TaxID=2604467 RepID=UPI0011D667C0|nr:hypothetical protein [Micromonospora sp. AP08]TYB40222.1 hypothetical protein FXF50_00300 [Micromonospora sp. AP08]